MRRRGSSSRLARPHVTRRATRDLALENAAAGCVGETFGTWIQLFQAEAAPQAELRHTARHIARDEARHAALAFRLFDWLDPKLSPNQRDEVQHALVLATQRLGGDCEVPSTLAASIGLPGKAEAARAASAILAHLPSVCA